MRVARQAKDLGGERTLALAAGIADDFERAGWALLDYAWLAFSPQEDSVIEMTFESVRPGAVAPPERSGSGLALEHPGRTAFLWTVVLPLVLMGLAVAAILIARH